MMRRQLFPAVFLWVRAYVSPLRDDEARRSLLRWYFVYLTFALNPKRNPEPETPSTNDRA